METASAGISEFTVPDSEKPKNKETCDSCDFSCDTEEDLTCHRESSNHINTTRIFKCYSCNVNFGEDSLLQKHIETTHAESIHGPKAAGREKSDLRVTKQPTL